MAEGVVIQPCAPFESRRIFVVTALISAAEADVVNEIDIFRYSLLKIRNSIELDTMGRYTNLERDGRL